MAPNPSNSPQLFAFTASQPGAQANLQKSIANPVDPKFCAKHLPAEFLQKVREASKDGNYYVWGATTGSGNKRTWETLQSGDYVLVYQTGKYTYLSRVIAKTQNRNFAIELWGMMNGTETWELVYFLEPPTRLDIPTSELTDLLPLRYLGFTRMADDRTDRITARYGSIGDFVKARILQREAPAVYLLLRSNEESKYKDEEGRRYHCNSNVANYTHLVPGAFFLVDRRVDGGKQIIGRGRIAKVVEEDSSGAPRSFIAEFDNYQAYTPPRDVTVQDDAFLRALPGYNTQHSIHVLTKEAFDRLGGVTTGIMTATGPLAELARVTYLTEPELQELEDLLKTKHHVILEGPPGSGKTYVAEKFARYFTGNPLDGTDPTRLVIVQFHQSYGYEDFVQGIRPETNAAGHLEYHVRPGAFMRFCEQAEKDPANPHVMIIDEINRGNISRIFGELLLLLEYRGRFKAALAYSAEDAPKFTIPANVYLIGTMNTSDRSLAQIDFALRRRFYFYRLQPVAGGRAPVLERWLDEQPFDADMKAKLLRAFLALNQRVEDELGEHFQVGHSYLMTPEVATDEGLRRVWHRAITPLLEEYFYNRRERSELLQDFALAVLLEAAPMTPTT
jgi:MoxR-like ATPase